jgi:Ca2+-binding EF-hand superfamily protein
MYRHVLGRQPDPEGQRSHALMAQQQGIDSVAHSLVSSAEYTNAFGDWGVPGSGGMRFCQTANASANNAAPQSPIADARFRGMDTNADGRITRQEWRGNNRSFQVQDWNGDGVLSGEEIDARPNTVAGQGSGYNFDALDTNRNNRIERREWQERLAEFNRLDANRDNFLSRAELQDVADRGPIGTSGIGAPGDLVIVDSTVRWTDTGITVREGQRLVFDTQGTITLSDNPGDNAVAGGVQSQRRAANAPVLDAPAGGLIARIGNSAPVFVGDRRALRAPVAGRLYLGVNDDHLADNVGQYRVTIDVR